MKLSREKWMPVKQVTPIVEPMPSKINNTLVRTWYGTPSLCWDFDAPEPLSCETLALLEKSPTYTTIAGTDVKIG